MPRFFDTKLFQLFQGQTVTFERVREVALNDRLFFAWSVPELEEFDSHRFYDELREYRVGYTEVSTIFRNFLRRLMVFMLPNGIGIA
jgi:hypothetical protein